MEQLSVWLVHLFTYLRRTRRFDSRAFGVPALIGLLLASAPGLEAQTAPGLTTLNPTSGAVGTPVVIAGSGFGAAPQPTLTEVSRAATSSVVNRGQTIVVPSSPATQSHSAGNLLVALFQLQPQMTITSVTNTANDTWTATTSSPFNNVTSNTQAVYYTLATHGSSADVVTATTSAGNTYASGVVYEFHTTVGTWSFVQDGTGSSSWNTAIATRPLTLPAPSVLVGIYETGTGRPPSSPSGTQASSDGGFYIWDSYQIRATATTGTVNATGTSSAQWGILGAAFTAGGGASTGTVTFNGTAASPSSWSDSSIGVLVPPGATSGPVVVTVGGQASNALTFTVPATASAPSLTTLNPTSGAVGTPVVIAGSGFGAAPQPTLTEVSRAATSSVVNRGQTIVVPSSPATQSHSAGNLLVALFQLQPQMTITSVTNTANDTWTATTSSPFNNVTSNTQAVYYTLATHGSSADVVTATTSAGNTYASGVVYEFHTTVGTWSFVQDGTGSSSWNTAIATRPLTLPAPSVLVGIYETGTGRPPSSPSGTQASSDGGFYIWDSYQIRATATTGTVNATGTGSAQWGILGAAFTAGGGASTGTVTFNGTAASPSSWSDSSIGVLVPPGATSGPVVVTVGGQASNALTFTVAGVQSVSTTATWNANSESNIAGYVLSYGTQSGVYSTRADVGNVTTWHGQLTSGVGYYFAVQAYNTSQQFSPYSAEVFLNVAGTGQTVMLTPPASQPSAQSARTSLAQVASQAALATTTTIDPTLAAFWQLNDGVGTTAFDASGHGMNGALVNGPAWITGHLGGALSFDGLDDHVTTNFVENLTRWSVAAWVQSPAAPSAASGAGPVQREKNFEINWNHPDAAFRGAVALSVGGTSYTASFGPLAANTWYHLVGTYDGAMLRAYVNGVLSTATPTPSANPDLEPLPLELGARAGATSYFAGVVNGVRIYSRAISTAEVAALAQPDLTPPSAVTLSASSVGEGVSLFWTSASDPGSGVSLYRIYRGTAVGGTKSPIAEGLASGLSYQDRGTTPFTTYYYEVRAINGNGVEGPGSNEAVVVTGQTGPALPKELGALAR